MLGDRVKRMGHRVRRAAESDRDALRVLERLGGELFDLRRERWLRNSMVCRLDGHRLDDAFHVRQEAHVEHAVAFVQHQDFDAVKADLVLIHKIQQAAGAGDEDLDALPQGFDLRPRADAPVNGRAAQLGAGGQHTDDIMDLLGQFAGGGDDQRAGYSSRTVEQFVEDGQHEGSGLACAGLGGADQVVPGERRGNGGFLDGGRLIVTGAFDPRHQAGIEFELIEVHIISLSSEVRRVLGALRTLFIRYSGDC